MEDIFQDTSMSYIIAQMARRLAFQLRLMVGAPESCTKMADQGLSILPKEWLVIADEWCADHKLDPMHGAMMLLHLQSMFGTNFSTVELRVILDEAYEHAESVDWYLG